MKSTPPEDSMEKQTDAVSGPDVKQLTKRKMRLIRARSLVSAEAQRQCENLRMLEQAIANARYSKVTAKQMQAMLDNESFIKEVLQLHKIYETAYERIAVIEKALNADFRRDPQSGEPLLEKENVLAWWDALEATNEQVALMPNATLQDIDNDLERLHDEYVPHLQQHNDNSYDFLDVKRSLEVMSAISKMLQIAIQEGIFSIDNAILEFRTRFNQSVNNTVSLEQARLRIDQDNLDYPEELINNWQDLIAKLDFNLAFFSVKLQMLFGPRACWLLSQVQMERLESMLMQMNTDINNLNLYVFFANEGKSAKFLKALAEGIENLVTARNLNNPANLDELKRTADAIRTDKHYLEKAIVTRRESERG